MPAAKLPSLSPIPAEPTADQLLTVIIERDALISALVQRVEDLEARVSQSSRNSSRPPSSEGYAKARSPGRAEQKAAGRKPGKDLAQVTDPDEGRQHVPMPVRGGNLRGRATGGAQRMVNLLDRQILVVRPSPPVWPPGSPTTSAVAESWRAPAACWWARTMVASTAISIKPSPWDIEHFWRSTGASTLRSVLGITTTHEQTC